MKITFALTPPVLAIACLAFGTASGLAFEVLGIGPGALLGGDLTDPENDGIDFPEPNGGGGFNWVSITANKQPYFDIDNVNPRQGSFDIFDNKVDNGEGKFCCSGAPWNVDVEFDQAFVLTHFTVTSNQDSIGRNPDVWQIQGSNDGTVWTEIFAFNNDDAAATANRLYAGNSVWTAGNQVIRWDGDGVDFATPAAYKWFRINADSAAGWVGGGGQLSLAEVEFFADPGQQVPFVITEIDFDSVNKMLTLTWNSKPSETYVVKISSDLTNWDSDIGDNFTMADHDENPDDGDKLTVTFDLAAFGFGGAEELFLRVEK
jgi:hypothetical protein